MITIKKFKFKNYKLLNLAHKIRHEVFVIEQSCPQELEWEFEEESTHFLVFDKEKAVATARYRRTHKGMKLERFAVLSSNRGKGYGKQVLEAIINDLNNFKGLVYMHAQVQVLPFYEKLGFEKNGSIFEEAGIMHFKMTLKRNQ